MPQSLRTFALGNLTPVRIIWDYGGLQLRCVIAARKQQSGEIASVPSSPDGFSSSAILGLPHWDEVLVWQYLLQYFVLRN